MDRVVFRPWHACPALSGGQFIAYFSGIGITADAAIQLSERISVKN
jgi:hypothetical protein